MKLWSVEFQVNVMV